MTRQESLYNSPVQEQTLALKCSLVQSQNVSLFADDIQTKGVEMDSSQPHGYAGKSLRIDLSGGRVSVEETEPEILRKFLSGVGYAAKLLYGEIPAGIILPTFCRQTV